MSESDIKFMKRSTTLIKIGLGLNMREQAYTKNDINVSFVEIKCDTDEEFEKKVFKIIKEIKRRAKVDLCISCNKNVPEENGDGFCLDCNLIHGNSNG